MVNNQDHIRRINNVILYIENNLSENLNIDRLAKLACFSKFHFNRIFKSITNESVYHYIKRVRLERSSYFLWSTNHSISEIASNCGFNTTSNFSYSFKKQFGVSPQEQRKLNSAFKEADNTPDIEVDIKHLPEMNLAYLKCIGSYDKHIIPSVKELHKWGYPRGVIGREFDFIHMGYDSHYVTKEENFRSDICIEVPEDTKAQGSINIIRFPRSKVISYKFRDINKVSESRDSLDSWILASGFQTIIGVPTIIICHGIILESNGEVDLTNIELEMCVPVKPK